MPACSYCNADCIWKNIQKGKKTSSVPSTQNKKSRTKVYRVYIEEFIFNVFSLLLHTLIFIKIWYLLSDCGTEVITCLKLRTTWLSKILNIHYMEYISARLWIWLLRFSYVQCYIKSLEIWASPHLLSCWEQMHFWLIAHKCNSMIHYDTHWHYKDLTIIHPVDCTAEINNQKSAKIHVFYQKNTFSVVYQKK